MVILFIIMGVKRFNHDDNVPMFSFAVTVIMPAIATILYAVRYFSRGETLEGIGTLIVLGFMFFILGYLIPSAVSSYWIDWTTHNNVRISSDDPPDPVIRINEDVSKPDLDIGINNAGILYKGTGVFKDEIGSYVNGIFYRGTGMFRDEIGSYENGIIYRGTGIFRDEIGSYTNGIIYRGTGIFRNEIGSYSNGIIYKGTGVFRDEIGSYKGGDAGAAAAAFILLFLE